MKLGDREYEVLFPAVIRAVEDGSQALTTMTEGEVWLERPALRFLPIGAVPGLSGGADAVVVAVYLNIHGDLDGHLILLFDQPSALRVVDMLLGLPGGSTQQLDALCQSALAEVGNVVGSALLNSLADQIRLKIIPSPPAVLVDMAGAILQSIVTELYEEEDEVLVMETQFNGEVTGRFWLMPNRSSAKRFAAALEAAR